MHKKIPNLSQNNAFCPNQSGTGTIPKVEEKIAEAYLMFVLLFRFLSRDSHSYHN
jgi:hypothetical protein